MFDGTARQAMEFYASVFGGELDVLTYAEGMGEEGELKDRLMHSSLYLERGAHVMAADTFPGQSASLGTVALSTAEEDSCEENARIASWWEKLAPESRITVPLDAAPWDPNSRYGQLTDPYGVEWMFMVGPTEQG